MSEQFLAVAQIVVTPNTEGFRAQLIKDVEAAKKGVIVKVAVAPDMTGFRAALQAAVKKSSSGVVAKVLVVPDTKGFRAALQTAVNTASRGVTAPVTPVGARGAGAGGAAATAGVSDTRVARAQLAIASATDAGIAARRRFDSALSASEKQMLRDQRISVQLKTATDAVAAASRTSVPALLAQAEALQLVALRENELNIARKARAAAPEIRAAEQAREAAAAAAAEAEAVEAASAKEIAARNKVAAANARLTTQLTTQSGARIAAIQAEIQAVLDQQAAEAAARKAELASARQARFRARQVATAAPFAPEAFARNTAVEESAAAAARSEEQFTQARRASQRAALETADLETRLTATRTAERHATEGLLEAEIALNEATAAGIPALTERRAQELALARTRVEGAVAATAQVESEVASAARLSQGGRALQAVGAQLAGLRGAALSANPAFIATAAALIAVTKAVQSAAQFESEISVFGATAGATADEMERVRKTALDLGRDITLPGVGAQDAAQALTELSKAGLSVQDSIDGARGVLQLATAAGIDNAQATELAASALNAFGLAGNQAVRVADTLANAANASQGSIVDIGIALRQASAVGRQAGLTLEQVTGVLTIFARNGLIGSDAGTSLRTALIRLINPTEKAQKVIDKLGLHLRTATGAINLNVFDEFTKKTQDLTAAQRDQQLAIIFGQDAIRGAAILAREGSEGLNQQIEGLKQQGTAAELANARMVGFTGSLENFKNQISNAGIAVGEILIPPLKIAIDVMADGVGAVGKLAQGFVDLENAAKDAAKVLAGSFPEIKIGGVDVTKQGKDLGQQIADNAGPVIRRAIINSIPVIGPGINNAEITQRFLEPAKTDSKEVAVQVNKILAGLKGSSEIAQDMSFTEVVAQLTKLQAKLAGSDKTGQHLASEISDIITQLKEGQTLPPFAFPKVDLPEDLKRGLPGKVAGEAITDAFDAALPGPKIFNISFNAFKNVETGIKAGLSGLSSSIEQALNIAENALQSKLSEIDKQARGKLSKLQSSALQLQVEGATPQQLLANARRQETQARTSLNAALAARPGTVSKDELDKRRQAVIDAHNLVKGFQGDIESETQKAAADAKSHQQKIQDAQNEADQALLDTLSVSTRKLDTRALIAQGTESLKDDIAVAKAQQQDNLHRISVISTSFKDRQKAAALIADLKDDNIRLSQQIAQDTQGVFDAEQQAFETKLQTAETQGNIAQQIALTRRRITQIERLIDSGKLEGKALQNYKNELTQRKSQLDDLRKTKIDDSIQLAESRDNIPAQIKFNLERIKQIDRLIKTEHIVGSRLKTLLTERAQRQSSVQELRDQQLADKTALAQSILDLTGNKSPLLKALTAEIANKRKEIAAAKAAGRSTVKLQTELNDLRKQRKEVLKTAEDGNKDVTSAFDLLKQANDTFNKSAGDLIGPGGQPFAGVTSFQADIAKFLVQRNRVGPPGTGLTAPTAQGGKLRVDLNDQPLIQAIERWIDTVNSQSGSGNTTTGGKTITPKESPWSKKRLFIEGAFARDAQQG